MLIASRRHPTPRFSQVAVAAALAALATNVHAQQASAPARAASAAQQQERIVVTGIRAAIEASIDAKRNEQTNVEVVTAEDVGKMPDKNIADALSRLSGVNVQFGGANAMDEAERVAIRGTSPNLNLVTLNGHALSSGDWHVGDQSSSGRSVGFGLMPSQLIGRAKVYKNAQADITEGGIAGTVDIQLRRPLDFKRGVTGEVSVGLVRATLPGKTDPQLSGLINWTNPDRSLGVLLQAFKEDRHLRRDGQETFSHVLVSAAQATASGDPSLANKRIPGAISASLFEGYRNRQGAFFGLQVRPNKDWDVNLQAFQSELRADNYATAAYANVSQLLSSGWLIRNPVVTGDLISAATITRPANAPATQRVVGVQYEQIVREGARSKSNFLDLDASWKVNKNLTLSGRVGSTKGSGDTNSQPHMYFAMLNPNIQYQVNGSRPTDFRAVDPTTGAVLDFGNPANWTQITGAAAAVSSTDSEDYLHLDGTHKVSWGIVSSLKVGLRQAKHKREYAVWSPRLNAQDNGTTIVTPTPLVPITGGTLFGNVLVPGSVPAPVGAYPSNYASGLNADIPRNVFRYSVDQVQAFANQYMNWDKTLNNNRSPAYTVEETNNAFYGMADYDWNDISGNFGLRAVETKVRSLSYQNLSPTCVAMQPCTIAGAITGSRFGTFLPQIVETTHNAVLPSVNMRWDLKGNVIARFSANKSLGRPNYNELAGAVSLNNTLLTGTSGNPNLKPITSNNLDGSLAWYFSKRGYVSGSVFQQKLKNYVKTGVSQVEFFNISTQTNSLYNVTSRYGVDAQLKGFELAAEVPIGAGFGTSLNYTNVEATDADGQVLLGTSRHTYNAVGYFENDKFSMRVAYNSRSDYPIAFLGNGTTTGPGNGVRYYKGSGTVSASLGYKITPNLSVTLDGTNLNNPIRNTYDIATYSPGQWHQSGRQFFLMLRGKM